MVNLKRIRIFFWLSLVHPFSAMKALCGKHPSDIDFEYIANFVEVNNPVIVEAGAFNGDDTYRFLQRWPTSRIVALEPIPALYEKLKARFCGFSNIVLLQSALVGSREQHVQIWTNQNGNDHSASSILQPDGVRDVYPDLDFEKVIEVDAQSLDALIESQKLETIEILWLDLQGAGLDVMRGSVKSLNIVNLTHLEVNRRAFYKSGATFPEVDSFLETAGFELLKLRMPFLSGNALYLKKKSL